MTNSINSPVGVEGKRPCDVFSAAAPASASHFLYAEFVVRGEAEAALLLDLAKKSVDADIAVLLAIGDVAFITLSVTIGRKAR